MKKTLTIKFQGREHGWGGPIIEWPADGPPKIDFGKSLIDSHGNRVVVSTVYPGQLILWGRSGDGIDRRRKFRCFGVAVRDNHGGLIAQQLPKDINARAIFLQGGRADTELPGEFLANTLALRFDSNRLKAGIELIQNIKTFLEAKQFYYGINVHEEGGLGAHQIRDVSDKLRIIAKGWPEFSEFTEAAELKLNEWACELDKARERRREIRPETNHVG